jgi:hypothetical protein
MAAPAQRSSSSTTSSSRGQGRGTARPSGPPRPGASAAARRARRGLPAVPPATIARPRRRAGRSRLCPALARSPRAAPARTARAGWRAGVLGCSRPARRCSAPTQSGPPSRFPSHQRCERVKSIESHAHHRLAEPLTRRPWPAAAHLRSEAGRVDPNGSMTIRAPADRNRKTATYHSANP